MTYQNKRHDKNFIIGFSFLRKVHNPKNYKKCVQTEKSSPLISKLILDIHVKYL